MISINGTIGEIYKGSTKIGKVYKGSTLLYQTGIGIQLYGWKTSDNYYVYTNKLNTIQDNVVLGAPNTTNGNIIKFLGMSRGELGAPNSAVKILRDSEQLTCDYLKTTSVNGTNVHAYYTMSGGFWSFTTIFEVIDNAEINSMALFSSAFSRDIYPPNIKSITDSTISVEVISGYSTTYNRYSSADFVWTNKAI